VQKVTVFLLLITQTLVVMEW